MDVSQQQPVIVAKSGSLTHLLFQRKAAERGAARRGGGPTREAGALSRSPGSVPQQLGDLGGLPTSSGHCKSRGHVPRALSLDAQLELYN